MRPTLLLLVIPLVLPACEAGPDDFGDGPGDDDAADDDSTPSGWGEEGFAVSDAECTITGAQGGDFTGAHLASLGDWDGDGLGDLAIAAPGQGSTDQGALYIFLGARLAAGGAIRPAAADHTIQGGSAGDRSGASFALLSDLDDDGRAEFLVGAPGGAEGGHAWLYLSSDLVAGGSVTPASAHFTFGGGSADDLLGTAVASLGDLDGDGLDEVAIGAPGDATDVDDGGRIYLLRGSRLDTGGSGGLGAAYASLTGGDAAVGMGELLVGGGDWDGDGLGDLLAGTPGAPVETVEDTGTVRIWSGATLNGLSGPVGPSDADAALIGVEAGGELGATAAFLPDTDADGMDEIVVGAPSSNRDGADQGVVYLALGASLVNSGTTSAEYAFAAVWATEAGDALGSALGGGEDVDGDGLGDLLLCASGSDAGEPTGGLGVLFRWPTLAAGGTFEAELADVQILPDGEDHNLGAACTLMPDFNGDGLGEIVVMAPGYHLSGGEEGEGRVYVILSRFTPATP